MALIRSVTVGDRTIALYAFTGEVVDEKKWGTTEVGSSGGGYNAGSGQNNPVTISSVSHTHDQFFLKNDSGQEMAVETTDAGLALRKGHRVTAIWGILQGMERGQYLAIYNHTTNTLTKFDPAIQGLAMNPPPGMLTLAWIASFVGICLYGLGLIGIVALYISGGKRHRKNKEQVDLFRSEVDRAIAGVKGA